jgi:hypothetical protein
LILKPIINNFQIIPIKIKKIPKNINLAKTLYVFVKKIETKLKTNLSSIKISAESSFKKGIEIITKKNPTIKGRLDFVSISKNINPIKIKLKKIRE